MNNVAIRETAKNKGVKFWQIAEKLNLLDSNFSRLMRHELSPEKTAEILKIIDELAKEKKS